MPSRNGCRLWLCAATYVVVLGAAVGVAIYVFGRTRIDGATPPPPDYALDSSWHALPWAADGADVVPAGCGKDLQADASADVFYVHPTSFFSSLPNADVADLQANILTDVGQLTTQASAFNGVGRVFAPRYRQASQTVQDSEKRWNTFANATGAVADAMEIAFGDVRRAFDHFLAVHSKPPRPIFLASHSQGTMHSKRLLRHIAATRPSVLSDRLVAAFIVGNTVSRTELPLKLCGTPTETRCFVTWNTLTAAANASHWLDKLHPGESSACVNPLSWRDDQVKMGRAAHKGGMGVLGPVFLQGFDVGLVDAQCDEHGMLRVSPPEGYPTDMTFKGGGELHAHDVSLFYRDIRLNAEARLAAWATGNNRSGEMRMPAEPATCEACASNLECIRIFAFQAMSTALVLWVLGAVLSAPIHLPLFLLCRSRCRRRQAEPKRPYPPSVTEACARGTCCCCCAYCCCCYCCPRRCGRTRACFLGQGCEAQRQQQQAEEEVEMVPRHGGDGDDDNDNHNNKASAARRAAGSASSSRSSSSSSASQDISPQAILPVPTTATKYELTEF